MSSRLLRVSAWIGVAFGVFLMLGETRRNWGAWGHWTSYTFDYLFAALLLIFGVFVLKGRVWARALLLASWALTVLLFTTSLAGHIREIDQPTYGPIPQLELTIWIGALDVVAAVALVLGASSYFAKQR
jgi:hypothetical protein